MEQESCWHQNTSLCFHSIEFKSTLFKYNTSHKIVTYSLPFSSQPNM